MSFFFFWNRLIGRGAGSGVDNLLLETTDNLLLQDGNSVIILEGL